MPLVKWGPADCTSYSDQTMPAGLWNGKIVVKPKEIAAYGASQWVQRIVRPIQIKLCRRFSGKPKPLENTIFAASQGDWQAKVIGNYNI